MPTIAPITTNTPTVRERSSQWSAVRLRHLVTHSACAACGRRKQLNVHHIEPFHVAPEKELEPRNLVTLCEEGVGRANCHLLFGHCGDWQAWNRLVIRDARRNRVMIANREEVAAVAK